VVGVAWFVQQRGGLVAAIAHVRCRLPRNGLHMTAWILIVVGVPLAALGAYTLYAMYWWYKRYDK